MRSVHLITVVALVLLGCGGKDSKPAKKPTDDKATSAKTSSKPTKPAPKADKPAPKVAKPAPKVAKPAPKVAKPAPKVAKPAPKVAKPAPKVAKPAPKVAKPAPKVAKPAPKVAKPAPKVAKPASSGSAAKAKEIAAAYVEIGKCKGSSVYSSNCPPYAALEKILKKYYYGKTKNPADRVGYFGGLMTVIETSKVAKLRSSAAYAIWSQLGVPKGVREDYKGTAMKILGLLKREKTAAAASAISNVLVKWNKPNKHPAFKTALVAYLTNNGNKTPGNTRGRKEFIRLYRPLTQNRDLSLKLIAILKNPATPPAIRQMVASYVPRIKSGDVKNQGVPLLVAMLNKNTIMVAGKHSFHGYHALSTAASALGDVPAVAHIPLVLGLTNRGKTETTKRAEYWSFVANAARNYLQKLKGPDRAKWDKVIVKKLKWILKQKDKKKAYSTKSAHRTAIYALAGSHEKSARKIIKKYLKSKVKDLADAAKYALTEWDRSAKKRAGKK